MKALFGILTCSLLLFSHLPEPGAQTYEGGVRGAARDAQGGVVPGATVTLVNEGTNATRTAITNEVGEYMFAKVVPGIYTLRAQVEGFKPYEQMGIEIGVQWFIVLDIRFEIGGIEETVIVRGESPIIETASASLSSTLENEEMVTLPTSSRNPYYLAITTPSVVHLGAPYFIRQQDHNSNALMTIVGGPNISNNYTLDGVPISDFSNRAIIIPSMEAVEEVKIQASTYDAEMGRTGGGVFNTLHKTGSNRCAGSALVQNRPQWGVGQLYFEKEAGDPKPDTYYWLYGGSFGGAIIQNKTFFWASTEGYRTSVTRNQVVTFPTDAMARGDFSQSGITIYDPLTTRPDPNNPGEFIRDPFPDNVIPADRLNTVGLNLASYLLGMGSGPVSSSANVVDRADQFSININHQFSDRFTLSGTYMYNTMDEPGALLVGGGPSDPGNYVGHRRIHVLALNNTFVPNDFSVYTIRYGYTRFDDDWLAPEFDPAELGFSQNYLDQISNTFTGIRLPGYGSGNRTHGGAGSEYARYYSQAVNATGSRFIGNHTLKLGGDYRRIGAKAFFLGHSAGDFYFDTSFTQGPNPNSPDSATGDPLADLLLGFPADGWIDVNTPNDFYINYVGFFVQDDWRVSEDVVLNFGLRVEHEGGVKEKNNAFTVGFDRETPWPVQPIDDMTLRGGLMYAGVDGYPDYQGEPKAVKLGPRMGFSWSINSKTVLRGGYGLFWAPPAGTDMIPTDTRMGTRGYSATTNYFATNDGYLTPAGALTDPFPSGAEQPQGGSLGLLTGAGTSIDFVDQFSRSPYVQQYSAGVQRELSGEVAVSASYLGSRSDDLSIVGTANINQLDTSFFSMGTALQEQVPNPFYGNSLFGNLSQTPTISRGQLLRPYPQFQDLWAHRVSEGRRRYHSVVLKAEKRFRSGWGARINYAWSRNDDNVSDYNHFSGGGSSPLNSYDLIGEYDRSSSDSPHRLNVSGVLELPFGKGKRWLNEGGLTDALLGGWSVSATGYYQSGFPIRVQQLNNNTGLFTAYQIPNMVHGVDPGHIGSTVENLDSYLNPAAWVEAEPFTFGNAPRRDTRVRSPFRQNWDFAFQKSQAVGWARLTVRAEIINAFDHPDFRGPEYRLGSRNFGRITRVTGFARTLQFMIRLDW
jgi:hypothetical protein